jgi:hypothetical protein
MTREFLAAVDAAVEQALPEGWPRVRAEKLPAHGSQRARHAFRLQDHTGPAGYLVIAVAPPFISRSAPSVRSDLEALIEHVLSRGASLLLLYDAQDDPDSWLRNGISCPHPRFLCLACTHGLGDACTTEPTHAGSEPLADTIRDLWSGELFYRGPTDGPQTVGVEILQDTCWRCHADIDTVTGIVFPDRKVDDWTSPQWTYFRQILELAAIPDILIPHLAAAIETWRAQPAISSQSTPPTNSSLANLVTSGPNANLVTISPDSNLAADSSLAAVSRHASDDDGFSSPLGLLPDDDVPIDQDGDDAGQSASVLTSIRWRHSKTAGHAYWAAECPSCTAFRGAFPIMERRLTLMHDLEARRTGELRYLPLVLDIPRDALRALMWGFECTAHARPLGWYRADILDPADPPDHPDPRHMPTRHLPLRPALAPLNPLAPRNTSNPHLPPGTAPKHQEPDPLPAAQPHRPSDRPSTTNAAPPPPARLQAPDAAPPPLSLDRPQAPDAMPPQLAPSPPPYDVNQRTAKALPASSDSPSSASPRRAIDTDDDQHTTSGTATVAAPGSTGAPVTRLAVSRVLCHADPQGNLHPLAVRSSHLERPRNAPNVSRLEAPPPAPSGPLRRLGQALFGRHLPWPRK